MPTIYDTAEPRATFVVRGSVSQGTQGLMAYPIGNSRAELGSDDDAALFTLRLDGWLSPRETITTAVGTVYAVGLGHAPVDVTSTLLTSHLATGTVLSFVLGHATAGMAYLVKWAVTTSASHTVPVWLDLIECTT